MQNTNETLPEEIKVTITAEHFAASEGYSGSRNCPLWQALHKMFPNRELWVGSHSLIIEDCFYKIPKDEWAVDGNGAHLATDHPRSWYSIDEMCRLAKTSPEGISPITFPLQRIN